MKDKKIWIFISLLVVAFLVVLLIIYVDESKKQKKTEDIPSKTTQDIDIELDLSTPENIDWSKYETYEKELTESITLIEGGVYRLRGNISNGLVTIDTNSPIKIILDNVTIKNSTGPAIFVKNAESVEIELASNSKNYLEDGNDYVGYEEDEIGTIFSHDNLILTGTGTLEVVSNMEDAIVSKDRLTILSGNYDITSSDDGIRGKDSLTIYDGTFDIHSQGDSLKSTNQDGYIYIANGNFKIISRLDGISSENKMLIQDGTFSIVTGNGSNITNGDSDLQMELNSNDTSSKKGLKAGNNLVLTGGTFQFQTEDDAIHSDKSIGIASGAFTISSLDDGIHAEEEFIMDDGTVSILQSYEGVEASKIVINGGTISLISRDDGINVAGGKDSSSIQSSGENQASQDFNHTLTITGGTIYVDALGDGIDVNGAGYIYGGDIHIDGPTDSKNGAIDYDSIFEMHGGTLLAGGDASMAQGCSDSSTIYHVLILFRQNYGSNDKITIQDSKGEEIISYESLKKYSSLVVATPKFEKNKSYKIIVNGEILEEFTITNISTNLNLKNHS